MAAKEKRYSKHGLEIQTGYACPDCESLHNSRSDARDCCFPMPDEYDAVKCPSCEQLTRADKDECDECAKRLPGAAPIECPDCGSTELRDFIGVTHANNYRGCLKCHAIAGTAAPVSQFA